MEHDEPTYEEKYTALTEDPNAGMLFMNLPIPAIGETIGATEGFENIIREITERERSD